jgi:hypothetical protein
MHQGLLSASSVPIRKWCIEVRANRSRDAKVEQIANPDDLRGQNVAAGTLRWPESKICAAWAERVSFVHWARTCKCRDCIYKRAFERGLALDTLLQRKGPKRATTCALAVKQEVARRRRILHDKALGGEAHAFSLHWRWNSKVLLCPSKQEVSNFRALSPKTQGSRVVSVKMQYI